MRQSRTEPTRQAAFFTSPRNAGSRGPASLIGPFISLGILIAWLAGVALTATETPDLSGTWELDKDLSDDPMEVMRGQRDGGRGRGMGSGGWGGRPGGIGGPPGGRGGPPGEMGGGRGRGKSPEEMRRGLAELRKSVERLELTQTAESIRIVFADGRTQAFTTNNKKNAIETPLGDAEVKARWRDGSLMVRTKIDRRMTIETYYLAEGGGLLTVVVERASEGPMGQISYKRIYRPVDPGAEAAVESESS